MPRRAWRRASTGIAPIFIHFGVFHIVFNGLWLWEFGRRIESLAGSLHFLLLVLVTGLVSNGAQYWWSGPSLFGGMSGVIFGLLGYLWIRNLVAPHPGLALPRGIVPLLIGADLYVGDDRLLLAVSPTRPMPPGWSPAPGSGRCLDWRRGGVELYDRRLELRVI